MLHLFVLKFLINGQDTFLYCYGTFYFIQGGAFEGVEDKISPFGYKRGEGIDAGHGEPEWIVNKERCKYDAIFESLGPIDGKISGAGKLSNFFLNR